MTAHCGKCDFTSNLHNCKQDRGGISTDHSRGVPVPDSNRRIGEDQDIWAESDPDSEYGFCPVCCTPRLAFKLPWLTQTTTYAGDPPPPTTSAVP